MYLPSLTTLRDDSGAPGFRHQNAAWKSPRGSARTRIRYRQPAVNSQVYGVVAAGVLASKEGLVIFSNGMLVGLAG